MLKSCPSRWFYFGQGLVVLGLLSFSYYLEWYQGLLPCPLCELQRLIFLALGLSFALAGCFSHRRLRAIFFSLIQMLIAAVGLLVAGRQVWLQYHPASATGSCDASIYYLFQILPFQDALLSILVGGPECAKVGWQFLHLGIPEWSLIGFLGFFLLALNQGLACLMRR